MVSKLFPDSLSFLPEARKYLNQIVNSCPRCLEHLEWCYEQELGKVYVKLDEFEHPFQNISIDPLGHTEVKAFCKCRKIVKVWPLLARCMDTGSVLVLIMESMETK